MSRYRMRRARAEDLDDVMYLLNARIAWLRDRGSMQWSTRDFRPIMTETIRAGHTWLLYEGARPLATLTMSTIGDPDFWTPSELATPALYLSKLATDPAIKGRGLGALLIDWANAYAHSWGVSVVRWDVWRTNQDLQDYYDRLGSRHVRTLDVPGRWSGALYEVAYEAPLDLTDKIITEVIRTTVAELPTSRIEPLDTGARAPNELYTPEPIRQHAHRVTGLRAPCLGSASTDSEVRELEVPGEESTRTLLFNPGDGWHLKAFFAHPITSWQNPPDLQPGRLYEIAHRADAERCSVVVIGDFNTSAAQPADQLTVDRLSR